MRGRRRLLARRAIARWALRLLRREWPHLAAIAVGIPGVATAAGWLLAGRELADLTRSPVD
jgi:hypothetical protein